MLRRGSTWKESCRFAIEALEERTLLSGVTLITHGFNSTTTGWVTEVADAIAARSPGGEASRYTLTVTDPGSESSRDPLVTSISARTGPSPLASAGGELQILLNWTDVADTVFGDSEARETDDVAAAVVPALLSPTFLSELGAPLAELPFHLIGHSRGASLVSELARVLGQAGVWVDQATFLDPNDAWDNTSFSYNDPQTRVFSNVIFADDYYQQMTFGFPNGDPVAGAYNRELHDLSGGYSNSHSDTHLWYYGTTDLATPANYDGVQMTGSMRSAWYTAAEQQGALAGFYRSRLGGGPRHTDARSGLSSEFHVDGLGSRVGVNRSGPQWPNVAQLSLQSPSSMVVGDTLSLSYIYEDYDSGSTINWFADTDQNPFNGGSIPLPNPQILGATGPSRVAATYSGSTAGLDPSYRYVYAEVADATHARFAYLSTPITLTAPPPTILSWSSAATHASGVGEVGLTVPDNNLFVESRSAGVRKVLVRFDRPADPATFTPASVQVASSGPMPGITLSTSLLENNTLGVISFSAALPNYAKYLVRLSGVAGPGGVALSGDADRVFTALIGDVSGDGRVNATDLSRVRGASTGLVNPSNTAQVRADVSVDGRVNATDLSRVQARNGDDARGIVTPTGGNSLQSLPQSISRPLLLSESGEDDANERGNGDLLV